MTIKNRKAEKMLPSDGNSPVKINYGRALLTQKGGWTLGELKDDSNGTAHDSNGLTQSAFDGVLRQVSRRISEPASRTKRT